MRGRREKNHTAPSFFSRLPRTPTTPFSFPLTVQGGKEEDGIEEAIDDHFGRIKYVIESVPA